MRSSLFSLIAVMFLASAADARAETAPYNPDGGTWCQPVTPSIAPQLPANVPGIPFVGRGLTQASLTAQDGTVIATTFPGYDASRYESIVAIGEPLTPGVTYYLRWNDQCSTSNVRTFVATAPSPLPATAGTLVVSSAYPPKFASCDASGRPYYRLTRDLSLDESVQLAPFLPVSDVDVIVDGVVNDQLASGWGTYRSETAFVGQLSHECPAAPREVSVQIRVRVANGPVLLTEPTTIELRCADRPAEPCTEPSGSDDAGTPGPAEGGPPIESWDAGDDEGAVEDAGSAPASADDAAGVTAFTCTASAVGAGGYGGFALAALALLGAARRRRA